MIRLKDYINEAIKHLPRTIKGLIVFDIDDTLLKADPSLFKIYKKVPGKPEEILTTDEYAKDPDIVDPSKKYLFDYRDFEDPVKVYNSIISGTPLIRNLKIMDSYVKAGYDFCFLTARGCEDIIKKALTVFFKDRNDEGILSANLGKKFKKTLSHAINDSSKKYNKSLGDSVKKGNVLKELCTKYDRVIFVDDDKKNVSAAKDLKIPNLKVIKAWEE